MKLNKILVKNPLKIYLLWFIILFLFCIIGIPLLSIGHSGGEQRPFILLGYTADIAVFGLIIISLISPLLYWSWYKKYEFIPLLIPILIIALLFWMEIHIYISNGNHFAL
jgi:phosphotransferase system  glucose/maltose/N-acetylglucosamine-specific IIC component